MRETRSARSIERVIAICASESDARALRATALDEMRAVIPFDYYVWLLTDPVSTVGTSPLATIPDLRELPALIKRKYLTDTNRWTHLISNESPVRSLQMATSGNLSVSRLWREGLHRHAVVDVASAVFNDRFGCWGFLDLWRTAPRDHFRQHELRYLSDATVCLTEGLRRCQATTFQRQAKSQPRELGPAVLMLDDSLSILSRTAATAEWLSLMVPPTPNTPTIPASVYNVAAQLEAQEQGIDSHAPHARTHLVDDFWVTVRAARLNKSGGSGAGTIAVTLEATTPTERFDVFARAFALTGRETEVLKVLGTGTDTRGVAQTLHLSEHTVQDHLKSIFTKTSVHNRGALLARAFGTREGEGSRHASG